MLNFLKYLQEVDMSKQANRDSAITNRISQKATEKEKVIDNTKNLKQKADARKSLASLRQREFEGKTGINFQTFSDIFNKVHK